MFFHSFLVLALSFLYTQNSLATPAPHPAPRPQSIKRPPHDYASFVAGPDEDGKYTIAAKGIRAQFVPYGASLSNLFVMDRNGEERDITLGWDNATYYTLDGSHPHLGGVPGRYANRIKNASFEIDGTTYHVDANEHGGLNTLHGGSNGWDWRNFTVVKHTADTVIFSIVDPDEAMGFPGEVNSFVTYTVSPYTWSIKMTAIATKKTPIMLSSHAYWNLDAFANPSTATALNHTLSLPHSGLRVEVDGILIPTGDLLANAKGSVNDFWSAPKQLGTSFDDPDMEGNCGAGCSGYDNCWIVERPEAEAWRNSPVATLSSDWSGIHMDVYSNLGAFQVYSCNGQNGSMALKRTQGFFDDPAHPRVVEKYGCVVLEVEDWIDGINHPEWMRESKQIFGPDDEPYVLEAVHVFSVDPSARSDI